VPKTFDEGVFSGIVTQSIIIAIVGYCVTLSMAKIYANKFSYKVDGNQELLSEVRVIIMISLLSFIAKILSITKFKY